MSYSTRSISRPGGAPIETPVLSRSHDLLHADVALAALRAHWRLAHGWALVSDGQFEHGAKLMDEVGRLLGA